MTIAPDLPIADLLCIHKICFQLNSKTILFLFNVQILKKKKHSFGEFYPWLLKKLRWIRHIQGSNNSIIFAIG